eukprot:CAMPEP_0181333008 /NCGR_PEP_ID=MMETSP1101-20121128/25423_1 /TAXON_ID=46948 /ORGANISM="Rhodomonas abbreviata, Strain Caron Lab Isolate" /LENGTH=115 /DNA_ID=CAMNT_0023442741 /DNA_START=47 /DNA_END=394 /DNA_ORIENTATION=+
MINNKDAVTNVWALARIPYVSPAHGAKAEVFVDSRAARNAPVRIAGEWVGHYPSLAGVPGRLVARAGTGWSVKFDGYEDQLFFNTEDGMKQLVFDMSQDIGIEETQGRESQPVPP